MLYSMDFKIRTCIGPTTRARIQVDFAFHQQLGAFQLFQKTQNVLHRYNRFFTVGCLTDEIIPSVPHAHITEPCYGVDEGKLITVIIRVLPLHGLCKYPHRGMQQGSYARITEGQPALRIPPMRQ